MRRGVPRGLLGSLVRCCWLLSSFALALHRDEIRELATDWSALGEMPHDPGYFTEGLIYEGGKIWESTGLNGASKLVVKDATTDAILHEHKLDPQYFGEGIAKVGNKILQLTWKSGVGFVYNADDLSPQGQFTFSTLRNEGWGMTYDGTHLVVSDGSSYLFFWDPETYKEVRRVLVSDSWGQVVNINELEYANGHIYANVWFKDIILKIDPASGKVVKTYDLSSLYPTSQGRGANDVLNGIAYDSSSNVFYLTGKNWAKMFKVDMD